MGLIRKALFLTTPGLVSPNSKKQRTANKTNRLLAQQNKLLTQTRKGGAAPRSSAAVAITRRYRVTCPSCGGEALAPASASLPCPHCAFNMRVTPIAP